MLRAEFIEEMRGIVEGFPSLKNRFKIDRIFALFENLPIEALKYAIDAVADEANPTPGSFKKAARDWKSAFYAKNGYYYGYENQKSEDEVPYCHFCFGTGVIKIKHHNPDDFLQLMRCSCDYGHYVASAKLPNWDKELKPIYIPVPLNPKWFNPNIEEKDELEQMYGPVKAKADQWMAAIRKSEQYWAGIGYEHKESK